MLILLVILLVSAPTLLQSQTGTAPIAASNHPDPAGRPAASRSILVIVDGLRADTAANPRTMPFLNQLAARGSRTTARVQALIPSTIAGITTLATGEIPPPISFLSDFGAPSSPKGGIFEAVTRAGGRTFVAGPSLWNDLYGAWITDCEPDSTFGHQDAHLLQATLHAIAIQEYQLIVIHFGRMDAIAHQAGAKSQSYTSAARWYDWAIRQIFDTMPPETCLLVTSDHGNIDRGGHAGPEPEVLTTPLVMIGPGLPVGPMPEVPQCQVPSLLLGALGLDNGRAVPQAAVKSPSLTALLLTGFAILCGLNVWSGLAERAHGRRSAFLLNLSVWLTLGLACFQFIHFALGIAMAGLAAVGLSLPRRNVLKMSGVLAAGTLIGLLRFVDGYLSLQVMALPNRLISIVLAISLLVGLSGAGGWHGRPVARLAFRPPVLYDWVRAPWTWIFLAGACLGLAAGKWPLLLGYILAVGMGIVIGRTAQSPCKPTETRKISASETSAPQQVLVGVALVGAYVLISRGLGETISLSTLNVTTAFEVVAFPWGIAWAAIIVAISQSIPALGLLVGLLWGNTSLPWSDTACGIFAASLAAGFIGQSLVMMGPLQWNADYHVMTALALGGILRILSETLYFFLWGALLLFLASRMVCLPDRSKRERTVE